MAKTSPTDRVIALARRRGVLRTGDVTRRGIAPVYLRRLEEQGVLVRSARGLYRLADSDVTEHHDLAAAAKRVPHGVVCLLSALSFHGLTTQLPVEVWLAIDRTARRPKTERPPMRVVRMSGRALTEGVESHRIEGVPVRVFNVPKTVADCFKYRNKIGLDVALEALREAWRDRRVTVDDLEPCSRICRVSRVIQPYLQMLS